VYENKIRDLRLSLGRRYVTTKAAGSPRPSQKHQSPGFIRQTISLLLQTEVFESLSMPRNSIYPYCGIKIRSVIIYVNNRLCRSGENGGFQIRSTFWSFPEYIRGTQRAGHRLPETSNFLDLARGESMSVVLMLKDTSDFQLREEDAQVENLLKERETKRV
jgi:hypothetical protein